MTDKSKFVFIGILVLILFGGGVVAGYYIWGIANGQKPDYPALLKDAAQYVAGLETRKSELEAQLEAGGTVKPVSDEPEGSVEGAVDDRVKSLEMRLESLREENAALQTALSSDKTADEKNLELTDRIQVLIQAKNTMEQENSTLRTQVSQAQGLSAENKKLKAQVASLSDIKAGLEKEKAESQSSSGQENQLMAANRELEMQAQLCANEKAELETKNAALQSVNDQNIDLQAENQKLKLTIASNAEEINTLKIRLDEIRAMANMKETSDAQGSAGETDSSQ